MGSASTADDEYAAFEEKVKRTVYLDNLSPQATESVIRSALNQYGNVMNIQIIPNYMYPSNMAQCALIELKDEAQASSVVETLSTYPFMMCGMPRPVRAWRAEAEMFDDRPVKPGRSIKMYWMDTKDPNFETAQKLKQLAEKHHVESSFMLKNQLEQEEKLSKDQAKALSATYQKYEAIDKILCDGTADRLASYYRINLKAEQ